MEKFVWLPDSGGEVIPLKRELTSGYISSKLLESI